MKTILNKKGQMKILESVAVLIVFFFLVGMGISFYGKIQLQSLADAKAEFAKSDAVKISQKIIHLPELRCSLQNTDQGSCIDLYQARAWNALLDDATCETELGSAALCTERVGHYFEQIGLSEVVLSRVYSSDPARQTDPVKDIVLYNYTTSTSENMSSTFTQIPVIIYDSVTQTSDLGLLQVRVYQ